MAKQTSEQMVIKLWDKVLGLRVELVSVWVRSKEWLTLVAGSWGNFCSNEYPVRFRHLMVHGGIVLCKHDLVLVRGDMLMIEQ